MATLSCENDSYDTSKLLYELRRLCDARNTLVQCDSFDDIIKNGLEIVQENLKCQSASIYLLSKNGILERKGLLGVDKSGKNIDDNWYPDECYQENESFTGKAIVASKNSSYGKAQWTNCLNNHDINDESKKRYLDKLGRLECAILIPLNGKNRSFGVLEVINKEEKGKCFNEKDVYWASSIGSNIATSITGLRRKNELLMLSSISKKMRTVYRDDFDLEGALSFIAKKLVNVFTGYKACIIRIMKSDENIGYEIKDGYKVDWHNFKSNLIEKNESTVNFIFKNNNAEFVKKLNLYKRRFVNDEWLNDNHFVSYCCFPLAVDDNVFGALSLFTGYEHKFGVAEKNFLYNIAYMIASIVESYRTIKKLNKTQKEIHDARNLLSNYGKAAVFDEAIQEELHGHKNELLSLLRQVKLIKDASSGRSKQLAEEEIQVLKEKIDYIQERFEEYKYEALNINHLIQDLVKQYKLETKQNNILFEVDYDNEIPLIDVNKRSILEVINNVISNAVKSIEMNDAYHGYIEIKTSIEIRDAIKYIQISIEDDGVGIRNEISGNIYDKGFTTFKGGTGQGLFFSKKIIRSYGGDILYKSKHGKGATFYILIPLVRHKN